MSTESKLPKITIITPSFNQGQYIEDTILSIINQGYPNLEYIIIDGASTDNTVEIIKKYNDKIDYWVSEKDRCHSEAINKGFRKATGDIINWINSDDQLMPGALHKIAEHFVNNPDAVIVHGRIEYFGETKNYYSRNISKRDIETKYVSHICMPQPASFYRRKLIDEQGMTDETLLFSMDTDFFVRAGLHYKLVQVEDVFARFRLHAASKSVSSFSEKFLTDNAIICSRVLKTLGAEKAIKELKTLGLYTEPSHTYHKPQRTFNPDKILFYFLTHRLSTLHFRGDKKEFKRIFSYLMKKHPFSLLSSGKYLLYRLTLFLPRNFLHNLAIKRDRSRRQD